MHKYFTRIYILFLLIIPALVFSSCSDKNKYVKKKYNYKSYQYDTDRAWLGIQTGALTDQLRIYFNTPEDLGVLVTEVQEDSPAEEYGLHAGDIIIQINNKTIRDHFDLVRVIDYYEPEEEVEIKIIRDRDEKSLNVRLGKSKSKFRRHYGYSPDRIEIEIPEIDIEIPEIDFEIPEIDMEELEGMNERVREEMERNREKIEEAREELQERLKEMRIRVKSKKSTVI